MDGWTWLGAEAAKGGLVAGGWRGWVGFTMVAFGVCCWDWVVVGVDEWLWAGCWWLMVAVVSAAVSHGVAVELVLGVGGVVGGFVGPWCWAGEFHTSQCSAFQLGWESA